jgi:hypothetical protein
MNSNTDNSTTDSEGWNSVTKNTKKSKKSEDKSKLIETSEKKSSTYSSIVKGNSVTTSNKEASTSDKEVSTADKEVSTADKEASTSDKEVTTDDKEVTTADKEVTTADKEVTTADKEVTTADKEASTSDSGSSSNLSNTKRFAKASAPINIKVNFTKRENPKNNLKDNNIEYKKALIIASQTFFNECIIDNKDFIEKEKIKISKFYNYKNTVHKVSYAKDFDSQKIGTQTIAFSRSHFAHNETFIKKLIIEYKNIFPECDWVKIRDSTRDDEPDTLIISIGRTIKLKN